MSSLLDSPPGNSHDATMPVQVTPPYTPLLYSKTGVYRGILYFLISGGSNVYTMYFLSKNKKNITIFHLKMIIFTAVKNHSILHGRVFRNVLSVSLVMIKPLWDFRPGQMQIKLYKHFSGPSLSGLAEFHGLHCTAMQSCKLT